MDKKNPLFLPKGTVRSILALGIVSAVIYALVSGNVAESLATPLVGLGGTVLGFYFGSRPQNLGS